MQQAYVAPHAETPATAGRGQRKPTGRRHSAVRRVTSRAGHLLVFASAFTAPLAAGGVHRPVLLFLLAASVLGGALLVVAASGTRRHIPLSHLLLAISPLLLTAFHLVPMPSNVQWALDPVATGLLESFDEARRFRALSLDPVRTTFELGLSVCAAVAFLSSWRWTVRNQGTSMPLRLVACAGIAALAIGAAHRLYGLDNVYGSFPTSSPILVGPFINPNHAAELLGLAAFAAFAAASAEIAARRRLAWAAAGVALMVGALLTLSRGAVLAAAVGGMSAILLLKHRATAGESTAPRPARPAAVVLVVVCFVVFAALAFGADPLLRELTGMDLRSSTDKPAIWRDSLRVLSSHPWGIGRGAFLSAYPIHRSVLNPLRYDYVENTPLQLLLDHGWALFVILAIVTLCVVVWLWRDGKRDSIEAIAASGLIALATHNLVDFGWETGGVRLPGAIVAGYLLGRARDDQKPSRSFYVSALLFCTLTGVVTLMLTTRPQARDFDALLRGSTTPQIRRALLDQAVDAHPFDYAYRLARSSMAPVVQPGSSRSPRLAELNRALQLCPRCGSVYFEAGRTLWQVGRRSQAIGEWRRATGEAGLSFNALVSRLDAFHLTEEELLALAESSDPSRYLTVSRLATERGNEEVARGALARARARGAATLDVELANVALSLRFEEANAAYARAAALVPSHQRDARVLVAHATAALAAGEPQIALKSATSALELRPSDVEAATLRVRSLAALRKEGSLDEALDDLRAALRLAARDEQPFFAIAADAYSAVGKPGRAVRVLRSGLVHHPSSNSLWRDLGRYAEAAGDLPTAAEAWRAILLRTPEDIEAKTALDRLRLH